MSIAEYYKLRCALLNYRQDQQARYLEVVHSALENNRQKFIEWADTEAAGLSEEERGHFYEFYQDEAIEVEDEFPRLLYSSFTVSWYSFAEQALMSLCKYLDLKKTIAVHDSENLGRGIRRAHKFLSKVANYEIDPAHWQELLLIGQLRNWIVHQGLAIRFSYFPSNKSKIVPVQSDGGNTVYLQIDPNFYHYLKRHRIIHLGLYHLSPTYDYCKHLVDFGKTFLKKIYTDLGKE